MNTPSNNTSADAIASALDQPTFKPAEAVRWLTRDPRSGNTPKHVERDIRTLRNAGITPEKIAGRWIVRAGELSRFSAAAAATPSRIDRRRREHRHLRASASGEVRHG